MSEEDAARRRIQRRAIAAGIGIVAVYVAVAMAPSSLLGTTIRRPVLDDGGGPTVPYNWVDPPESLAGGNQQPSRVSSRIPLGPDGSQARTPSTSDAQITLVVFNGTIAPSRGASDVLVDLSPLAPTRFPAAPQGFQVVGNVYRVEASYLPARKPVTAFADPGRVVLIYPQIAPVHSSGHEILYSRNGQQWEALKTTDYVLLVQAEAALPGPGYVAVAGVPGNTPTSSTTSGGGIDTRTVILVILGCVVLVGIGAVIRLISKKGKE